MGCCIPWPWHHQRMATVDATGLSHALHDRPDAPLCVGFSGGLDSTVLLHLLASDGVTQRIARGARAPRPASPGRRVGGTLQADLRDAGRSADRDEGERRTRRTRPGGRRARGAPCRVRGDARAGRSAGTGASPRRPGRDLAAARAARIRDRTAWRRCGAGARSATAASGGPCSIMAATTLLAYAAGAWPALDRRPQQCRHRASTATSCANACCRCCGERWPHAGCRVGAIGHAAAPTPATCSPKAIARRSPASRTRGPALPGRAAACPRCLPPRRARVLRRWIARLGLPPLPAQGDRADRSRRARRPRRCRGRVRLAWRCRAQLARPAACRMPSRPPLPRDWRCAWDGRTPLALPRRRTAAARRRRRVSTRALVVARAPGWRTHRAARARPFARAQARAAGPRRAAVGARAHAAAVRCRRRLLAVADLAYSAAFDAWLRERGAWLRWDEQWRRMRGPNRARRLPAAGD